MLDASNIFLITVNEPRFGYFHTFFDLVFQLYNEIGFGNTNDCEFYRIRVFHVLKAEYIYLGAIIRVQDFQGPPTL